MKKYNFDYNKFILDNYIRKDKAIIKVLMNDKEKFYNQYDPRRHTINNSIMEYITEEAYNIPFKYDITIEFYCDDLTEEEKDLVRKMVRDYYGVKIINKRSVIKISTIKSLCLILLGALMIAYSALNNTFFNYIYLEIVYVIGWVLIWEGTEILLLSNNEDKVEKKNYKQLYNADILFSDTFELKD